MPRNSHISKFDSEALRDLDFCDVARAFFRLLTRVSKLVNTCQQGGYHVSASWLPHVSNLATCEMMKALEWNSRNITGKHSLHLKGI